PDLSLSLVATALVALAFQPLGEWLQRAANRLVYGRRASPYEVLSGFSRRMAGALTVDQVLPSMAEAAAFGVGAARSRVRDYVPGGRDLAPRSSGRRFNYGYFVSSPTARARATTCTRLSAPSLAKTWLTWVLTVARLTTRRRAISWFESRWAMSCNICSSRWVTGSSSLFSRSTRDPVRAVSWGVI